MYTLYVLYVGWMFGINHPGQLAELIFSIYSTENDTATPRILQFLSIWQDNMAFLAHLRVNENALLWFLLSV